VLRAAAACRIPLISAVGHETDTTLIDFVSDRRAPTPTAAAEMAIPARADLLADLAQKASRLLGGLNRKLQEQRLRLSRAERGLPDPAALLGAARQRLDDRGERLRLALPNLLLGRRTHLTAVERRMPDLPALIAAKRAALGLAGAHLGAGLRHFVAGRRRSAGRTLERLNAAPLLAMLRHAAARLEGTGARLEAVSPLAVLARGYALVQHPSGRTFTSAAAIPPGQRLVLRFADGEVAATAEGGASPVRQGRLPL
jgi:exodeoxyribonuclease VII large subunit